MLTLAVELNRAPTTVNKIPFLLFVNQPSSFCNDTIISFNFQLGEGGEYGEVRQSSKFDGDEGDDN
jgi:hypothetical protein